MFGCAWRMGLGCARRDDGTGLCAEGGWQYESVYGGWEIKGV
jgi:hypothetical protein